MSMTTTTTKKTAAQLRRLQKRAAQRGETYIHDPPVTTETSSSTTTITGDNNNVNVNVNDDVSPSSDGFVIDHSPGSPIQDPIRTEREEVTTSSFTKDDDVPATTTKTNDNDEEEGTSAVTTSSSPAVAEVEDTVRDVDDERRRLRTTIARRLQNELIEIEQNADLKAKDRRSAKRKAEAIAAEEAGMLSSVELLEWYENNQGATHHTTTPTKPSHAPIVVDPKMEHNMIAAKKLLSELDAADKDVTLKSKDRRSAKRKAEAIASEATGMEVQDLLKWYDKINQKLKKKAKGTGPTTDGTIHDDDPPRRHPDPYIAFFGQLSYETTKEDLMEHIRSQLGDTYKVSTNTVKVRMLTDPQKDNRFRGMAFVQVDDPDFLYALLKLHQTYLKGRRINVEKSAGGKKGSDTRQQKLSQHKKDQQEYFAQVVQSILDEYRATKELRDDELDEGVITLCKRHAGPVVRAAVAEYIEKGGRDMDNPSAYLTFLVAKFAAEGIHDQEETGKTKKNGTNKKDYNNNNNPKKRKDAPTSSSSSTGSGWKNKEPKRDNNGWKKTSELAKSGVDMSMSVAGLPDVSGGTSSRDLATIFPSSQRGRGRGYMRNVR